jgi:hypothetical protein
MARIARPDVSPEKLPRLVSFQPLASSNAFFSISNRSFASEPMENDGTGAI